MKVSVDEISPNQKRIRVDLPAEEVQQEFKKKYTDLAKRAKIKGFRPGKVPLSIIKSYYGKAVEHEVSSQFIQDTFPDALKQSELKPLMPADVGESHLEDDGSFSYTALVDICPPFELPGYKELKLYKAPIEITEEQVQAELDRLVQSHAQLRAVEDDRPIMEGDVAVVDFTPNVDGQVFEKGKTQDFMAEIGKGSLHPDFDSHLVGHKPGDSLSFELEYAQDAPTPEIAGKTVRFDVVIKELKQKELPELNDEFAQALPSSQFDSLDALKEEFRKKLLEREEGRAFELAREQIIDNLLGKLQFEISPRVVEREVDGMVQNLKYQFESQGLQLDFDKLNAPEYRSGYRLQAERNIRTRLVLDKIAEAENLELDFQDNESIFKDIALSYRIDPEKVKREYAESAIVEQAKERKLQDKVLKFIESEATFVDKPEDAKEPETVDKAEDLTHGEAQEAEKE
ncbi:MAG: trigger factor [Syntrophobacteraceae bacterium]